MRNLRLFGTPVFAAVWILAIASIAFAGDDRGGNRFRASLTGFQEVPAVSTTGTGTLTLEIQANQINYTLNYRDMEGGAVTASHIHLGQRSVNGGVIAHLCGGTKPACTTPSGSFEGVITPADIIGPAGQGIEGPASFGEVVRAIRAGVVYANVHSTRWSSGEIRGQVINGRGNRGDDNDDEDDED